MNHEAIATKDPSEDFNPETMALGKILKKLIVPQTIHGKIRRMIAHERETTEENIIANDIDCEHITSIIFTEE